MDEWIFDATGQKGLLDKTKAYSATGVLQITTDYGSYDDRNRPASKTWTVAGVDDYTMSYTYDEADHLETLTYPTGETVTYDFDGRTGLPNALTGVNGQSTYTYVRDTTWTPQGQPLYQQHGADSGTYTLHRNWIYNDDDLRLYKIRAGMTPSAYTDVAHWHMHYDTLGNVTQVNDWRNSSQVQCFAYDNLSRLTSGFTSDDDTGSDDCADGYTATGSGIYDYDYTYNPVGNMTTVVDNIATATTSYTYGAGTAGPHAATTVGTDTMVYDANGNMTTRATDTVTWTDQNQLDTYTTTTGDTWMVYGPDADRIVRVHPDDSITVTLDGLYETDGTTPRTFYTFNGIPVATRSSGERVYLVGDHLGSVAVTHNYTTGTLTRHWFDPYGAERANSGTSRVDRTYTGQTKDTTTSLMFYNARYYDPTIRRFVSPDTIIPNPANPQDLNRYSYVTNNPMTYVDPTGHCSVSAPIPGLSLNWVSFLCPGQDPAAAGKSFAKGVADLPGNTINLALDVNEWHYEILTFGQYEDPLPRVPTFGPEEGYESHYIAGGFIAGVAAETALWRAVGVVGRFGSGSAADELPMQLHHFATNKNSVYSPRMEAIACRYGLNLDDAWNTTRMPHLGRHPNAYHDFVLRGMEKAAIEAGDDATMFVKLFDRYVRRPVVKNPDLLRRIGWE